MISTKIPVSFPFSPSLPKFLPALEKSGHGGPPMIPKSLLSINPDDTFSLTIDLLIVSMEPSKRLMSCGLTPYSLL